MKIFDAKNQFQKLEEKIKNIMDENPKVRDKVLTIVLIGTDPSSEKFIKIKSDLCEKLGIKYKVFKIDENLSDGEIFRNVKDIFESGEVGGGIIQLPLPRESLYRVLDFIPVEKDVDVISTEGKSRFYSGDFSVLSPVVRAFENFINENEINLEGLKSVVVGDGELVGKPISFYLEKKGSVVEVLNDYDGSSKLDCELLLLASGVSNLIKGENISEGCDVVDFGSSVIEGKCVGDLDMTSSLEHLGCVSKSPGGMGPLVVRYLMLNYLMTCSL
ncbi:bifunctional 5,10-methylenetetrahydrofolate dehydrogenase/5,10-methenyltetrahydrofolate cyclohydrolase [Patescibacteria group bacterium]|nr:bifunctional 5,10-methylenetetrahydrofolate dehydrogenase/5,10-methenyltetrahydrofolate cyclohydrolase [Patescibacteria group bacterium]